MRVFIRMPKAGIAAQAEYNEGDNSCIVLKGSIVSKSISEAPKFHGKRAVAEKRKYYVDGEIVKENVYFKSPSTAANFVTGKSTDGCNSWKDELGRTIRKIKEGA